MPTTFDVSLYVQDMILCVVVECNQPVRHSEWVGCLTSVQWAFSLVELPERNDPLLWERKVSHDFANVFTLRRAFIDPHYPRRIEQALHTITHMPAAQIH